jgi:hypothetical protein
MSDEIRAKAWDIINSTPANQLRNFFRLTSQLGDFEEGSSLRMRLAYIHGLSPWMFDGLLASVLRQDGERHRTHAGKLFTIKSEKGQHHLYCGRMKLLSSADKQLLEVLMGDPMLPLLVQIRHQNLNSTEPTS